MDHSQSRIAVLYIVHQDPDCKKIIDLINGLALIDHFFIDAEEMLDPSVHLSLDPRILHMLLYLFHNPVDKILSFTFFQGNLVYQIVVHIRLQVFKRKIIQFHLDLRYTKAHGNGRINIHGLPGLFLLLFRTHVLQSTHIVETVRKLDQNYSDILCHGKKHFS